MYYQLLKYDGRSRRQVSQVLRLARNLLVERGWARGELAYDASGSPAHPESPQAVSFCAVGAVLRAAADLASPEWSNLALDVLEELVDEDSIPEFNDRQDDVSGVLGLLDAVIESLDSLEAK